MADNTITLQLGGSLNLVLSQAPPEFRVKITARYGAFAATATVPEGGTMAYTMPIDTFIEVQVAYIDASGNPATVDGPVAWASSDETLVTVTIDGVDSTICTVTALGKVGLARVTATADADLGAGTRELVTFLDCSVIAGEAVAGTINVLAPPQPVAAITR